MRGSLNDTELRVIRRIVINDVHRQLKLEESVLFVPVHHCIETNQAASVHLETGRNRIENDVDGDTALTNTNVRLDDTSDRTALDDAHRAKVEMGLRLKMELVNIPRTALARSLNPLTPNNSDSLP